MGLEIVILHQVTRANTRAVYDEIEFAIDAFKIFHIHVCIDFAAGSPKTVGEIIEINCRVR